MQKTLLLTALMAALGSTASAKQVDETTAKQVGKSFLSTVAGIQSNKVVGSLSLAYKATASNKSTVAKIDNPTVYYYVFNTGANGFVIVSGDDNVTPILGYSSEGSFDPGNVPKNAQKWFEEYKSQIRYAIEHNVAPTPQIQVDWKTYMSSGYIPAKTASSVTPLVAAKWNQDPYYNDMCPLDNASGQRTVTGCVATAMAQIMKYWSYPARGSGFHSYNHPVYGTISANFGGTTYNWDAMPNAIDGPNSAIATLMHQVGVSVDMNYGIGETGGSSAYVISAMTAVENCSEFALKTYFGYKNTLQGVQRVNYEESQWLSLLKGELDAKRPILYAGFGSGGGHAFVCDGYDENNFFHFNWGWGGAHDGYFAMNALNPGGLGTGGGTGGYNSGHQAVIGIEPPTNTQTYDIGLYSQLTPSESTIYYGQSFTLTASIANYGSSAFTGDYCVMIFDSEYRIIDSVDVLNDPSLAASSFRADVGFTTSGLFSMLPGTYTAALLYRPAGGNWLLASNGEYTNAVQMTVINPNAIELKAAMDVQPGTVLTQGSPVSVTLNLVNDGQQTFTGSYGLGLYNLDGTVAEVISIIQEGNGLPSGHTYEAPLVFSLPAVTVEPGSYLLALQHSPAGQSWQLTGSTYHQNPIRVTVQAAGLSADSYEQNDAIDQASALPLEFVGEIAGFSTKDANFHVGADQDYYKIELPAGYTYKMAARLQDSYKSEEGEVFSADALFSYSTDGGATWSNAYDDLMSEQYVEIANGGTVYFHVAPYFSGETGTYMFEVAAEKGSPTSISEEEATAPVRVYPNPAKHFVTVDLAQVNGTVSQVNLLNVQGKQLQSTTVDGGQKTLHFSLESLSDEVVFVQILSSEGTITKKVVVSK